VIAGSGYRSGPLASGLRFICLYSVRQFVGPSETAELQDEMATMMAMYQASSTVSGPLPNEAVLAVAEPFAYAAITVFEYCGLTYTG
jgi:hypothetical protein